MLAIGTRLLTKDGRKYGNAIVIAQVTGFDGCSEWYQIESDFGNVFFKADTDIDEFWWVADDQPEEISLERWRDARHELLWSRSSMEEQGSVEPQDAGSVPVVTAKL